MQSETFNIEISEIDNILADGIAAAKAGQPKRARNLLKRTIQHDPANIKAWVWLSSVVEEPEQQEHCLQKILAIDPTHKAAKKGLQALQRKKAKQKPRKSSLKRLSPAALTSVLNTLEAASSEAPPPSHLKRLQPKTDEAIPPSSPKSEAPTKIKRITSPIVPRSLENLGELFKNGQNPVEKTSEKRERRAESQALAKDTRRKNLNLFHNNELLCPYCAGHTQPDDEICPICQQNLWQADLRQKKPSRLYRFLFWSHVVSNIINLSAILLILQAAVRVQFISPLQAIASFTLCIPSVIYFLAILMALQRRARIFFRLYLIQAIIFFALGSTVAIGIALSNIAGPIRVLTGLVLVLAISQFFMALNLGEDFTFDRKRIYLRPDKDIKDAGDFMRRGNHYAKQKMWALAAIHFRRASLLYPHNIDPLLSLVVCFINLDSYDNAAEYLTRAMEIDSTHRRVAKLTTLLADRQAEYYAQQQNRVPSPNSLRTTP